MVEEFLTNEQKEFLDNKPPGNIPKSFPEMFLNRSEKVIYEGRPSIVSYIARPVVVGIIYIIVLGISFFALLNPVDSSLAVGWLLFVIIFLFLLPLLFSILRWSRTYYALTDRRVTHTYGLFSRKSADIPLDKIMSVVMSQPFFERIFGYGSIIFTTAGSSSIGLKDIYRTGAVVWRASTRPVQLKNYVQEALDVLQKAQKTRDYKEMAKVMKE
jgi:uncharacterized membrane protein YdbT with pleckstrin-like domain